MEEFDQFLGHYGEAINLLNSIKKEANAQEVRLTETQGRVDVLEKNLAKLEGGIDTLTSAGLKTLQSTAAEIKKQIKAVAEAEVCQIKEVGQEFRKELIDYQERIDDSMTRVFQSGQEFERTRQELRKYEGLKDVLESHKAESEREK